MATHRKRFLKKYNLEDQSYSLEDLAEISNVPEKVLQEVYNRGIGAYKTNPESVRIKGTFKKGPAPMSQKLSKEQWAMARVYSFLDGSKKHDQDLRTCPKCGGSKYTDAIKKFNAGKPAWCMPRKGTELHTEVLRIMNTPKKPTRKLRLAPVESVTNLGKEGRKRIEEFSDTKPIINKMTSKTCPYCNKEYKNLTQHITKAHVHFYIEIDRNGEEPKMTVTNQDGKVLKKDDTPSDKETRDGRTNWTFYFESKAGEGTYVELYEDGEVEVNRDVYNTTTNRFVSTSKAFKNWSVKFIAPKKPTRKLRLAPVAEEQPKKWYEHKLWSDGTYRYELDPVMRPGKTYFFKNLTSEEEQKQRGETIVSSGFNMRPNKDGLPTKTFLSKFKPV